uniref:Capsid protein n=1 Tax=Acheta domesticus volvovirus TaxID=1291515 RepID=M9TEA1_9VIRU|nr:hypothetical protein [Acheta domesticus volvovirus]
MARLVKSSRRLMHRRRRRGFAIRRRRYSGRRRYSTRRRYSIRRRVSRSLAIPRRGAREFSWVLNLHNYQHSFNDGGALSAIQGNQWYLMSPPTLIIPYQAFRFLFKEWRLTRLLVAIRRRYPEPVVYQPNQQEQTVAASRLASNNIWWCPWGKYDRPEQAPRQTKSAILLTSQWAVRSVSQRCQRLSLVSTKRSASFVSGSTPIIDGNEGRPGGGYGQAALLSNVGFVAYWGRWPTYSFSDTYNATSNSDRNDLLPVANLGFIAVENLSEITPDAVEIKVKAFFSFKGRKNLGSVNDSTGAFTSAFPLSSTDWYLDNNKTVPPVGVLEQNLLDQVDKDEPVEMPDIGPASVVAASPDGPMV